MDMDKRYEELGFIVLRGYRARHGVITCMKAEQKRRQARPIPMYSERLAAYAKLPDAELAAGIAYLTYEQAMCDYAIAALPDELRGPAMDVYVHGVSWVNASFKWHIGESGLSRRFKRAARMLGRMLLPEVSSVDELKAELFGGNGDE